MSNRVHGITLPDGGVFRNFKTDTVTDNPSVTDPGYIHYNSTLKDFVVSYNDGSFDRFITESTLTDKVLGLDRKKSVRVATTESIIVADCPDTIDGISLVVGDRILVKDCSTASDNGIYIVLSDDGDGTVTVTRSEDADNSPTGEVTTGMFTIVNEGTANGGKGYILVTPDPITLGTTNLTFTQWTKFGDVGIDPNGGLSLSGSNVSILKDPAENGLTLSVAGLKVTDDWIKTDALGMLDIPDTYGTAEQILKVNATTDGFDFADDPDTLIELGVPAYVANNVLVVNETTDGFILTDDSLLQAEVDNIQAAAGLETTGSFSAYSGSSYLDTTTSLTNATSLYDTALDSSLSDINNRVYNITTSTPATQHTINHSLGTQNVYTSVYVYNFGDSNYHREYPDIEVVDDNNIVINMITSSNVKVVVKSLETI